MYIVQLFISNYFTYKTTLVCVFFVCFFWFCIHTDILHKKYVQHLSFFLWGSDEDKKLAIMRKQIDLDKGMDL